MMTTPEELGRSATWFIDVDEPALGRDLWTRGRHRRARRQRVSWIAAIALAGTAVVSLELMRRRRESR